MDKHYISASQLLKDSFDLAWQVYESGYRPNCVVGVLRGGTPVGIAVQELLEVLGVRSDHCAVQTISYSGIAERATDIQVSGLDVLVSRLHGDDQVLLVDDVHDTGLSLARLLQELEVQCQGTLPEVRIATPYFKPGNNQTGRVPDYFLYETDDWLVFPHELSGLDIQEIAANKPEMQHLVDRISKR